MINHASSSRHTEKKRKKAATHCKTVEHLGVRDVVKSQEKPHELTCFLSLKSMTEEKI